MASLADKSLVIVSERDGEARYRMLQTVDQYATELLDAEGNAAETQLRAEQDRFGVGATTNFFVLTRQTDLAEAQLTEIDAQTAYRRAMTEFGRATGTLLRDRSVQVE